VALWRRQCRLHVRGRSVVFPTSWASNPVVAFLRPPTVSFANRAVHCIHPGPLRRMSKRAPVVFMPRRHPIGRGRGMRTTRKKRRRQPTHARSGPQTEAIWMTNHRACAPQQKTALCCLRRAPSWLSQHPRVVHRRPAGGKRRFGQGARAVAQRQRRPGGSHPRRRRRYVAAAPPTATRLPDAGAAAGWHGHGNGHGGGRFGSLHLVNRTRRVGAGAANGRDGGVEHGHELGAPPPPVRTEGEGGQRRTR